MHWRSFNFVTLQPKLNSITLCDMTQILPACSGFQHSSHVLWLLCNNAILQHLVEETKPTKQPVHLYGFIYSGYLERLKNKQDTPNRYVSYRNIIRCIRPSPGFLLWINSTYSFKGITSKFGNQSLLL